MGGYLAINAAYSLWLRHVELVDVCVIAAGFVLRVLAGTTALGIAASQWIVLAAGLLALLLAIGKRRVDLGHESAEARRSLSGYSMEFIDVAESVTVAAQAQGLHTVGFSSSPGGGHDRTIRRAGPHVLVAVNRLGRPAGAVVGDLIDGVIAANGGNGNREALMAAAHNTLTDRRRAARQNPKG